MLLESTTPGVSNNAAFIEGWGMFDSDSRGLEIERDDEREIFTSDEEARRFVRRRARQGSESHIRALGLSPAPEAPPAPSTAT